MKVLASFLCNLSFYPRTQCSTNVIFLADEIWTWTSTKPTSSPSGVSPAMDSLVLQLLQRIRTGENPGGREAARKYMGAKRNGEKTGRPENSTHVPRPWPYLPHSLLPSKEELSSPEILSKGGSRNGNLFCWSFSHFIDGLELVVRKSVFSSQVSGGLPVWLATYLHRVTWQDQVLMSCKWAEFCTNVLVLLGEVSKYF